MKVLNFEVFMKNYHLKDDTMNETELQENYKYIIYPRDSKKFSGKGTVNIDNGSRGGTYWTCFIVKENKSFCFGSFGGQPDKFLLIQLPKPIIYHNYKIPDINCNLCGSYCLYFFYLIGRMNYYDAVLKLVFSQFYILLINVFGNSNSKDNGNETDTSLFVQKPFLRTNYIEANIEEDIDLKTQI